MAGFEYILCRKVIEAYRSVSVSPEFQEMERMRSKARHDEAQALENVRREEKFENARNALGMGLPLESIMKLTGLRKEIEEIRQTN